MCFFSIISYAKNLDTRPNEFWHNLYYIQTQLFKHQIFCKLILNWFSPTYFLKNLSDISSLCHFDYTSLFFKHFSMTSLYLITPSHIHTCIALPHIHVRCRVDHAEASEPKRVNSISNIIGVNTLRLKNLHIITTFKLTRCINNKSITL